MRNRVALSVGTVALEALRRDLPHTFSVAQASEKLAIERIRTRRLLRQLVAQGSIVRIRRDIYSVTPVNTPKAIVHGGWREDPWLVAAHTFGPLYYIGGWMACEHWALLKTSCQDVLVITNNRVAKREVEIQGTTYKIKVARRGAFFGLWDVWRGQNKIKLSDPTRTVIDALNDPWCVGGIEQAAAALAAYFKHEKCDKHLLLDYARRLGNRTVYKRLGYLVELRFPGLHADLITECRLKMSEGLSWLDQSGPKTGRIKKKWNLRINAEISDPMQPTDPSVESQQPKREERQLDVHLDIIHAEEETSEQQEDTLRELAT